MLHIVQLVAETLSFIQNHLKLSEIFWFKALAEDQILLQALVIVVLDLVIQVTEVFVLGAVKEFVDIIV